MPAPLHSQILRGALAVLPPPLSARMLLRRLPRHVLIEPTNHCNLRCPLCFQSNHPRQRGMMRLAQFRTLVDELRGFADGLVLQLLGESTLHPELFAMIAYAEGLGLHCTLTTNGTLLERKLDELLDSRLSALRVTVEGIDAATHERYRVGSDFEAVKRGVERLCNERRRRGLERPHIAVQTLAFGFNAGQRAAIRDWALRAGADAHVLREVHLGLGHLPRPLEELAREFLGGERRDAGADARAVGLCKADRLCEELYRATILWNGDVVPCMRGAWNGAGAFGNVLRDGGFKRVWRSQRRLDFLLRHAGRDGQDCEALEALRVPAQ